MPSVSGDGLDSNVYHQATLSVGNPYQTSSPNQAAAPTGYPRPSGSIPIARFFGDLQIVGDLYLSGRYVALNTATGEQINVIAETLEVGGDLRVTGNTVLGTSTNTSTDVRGTLEVGRWLHVKALSLDRSRFDYSIDVTNPGNSNNALGGTFSDTVLPRQTEYFPDLSFHKAVGSRPAPASDEGVIDTRNTVFDGLDASYLAKLLTFRSLDRHDYKPNTVNDGIRKGIAGRVTANPGNSQAQFMDTGLCWPPALLNPSSWESVKTDLPTRWYNLTGNYYHGKFENKQIEMYSGEFSGHYIYGDGNQWLVEWTSSDSVLTTDGAMKEGSRQPLNRVAFTHWTGQPYAPTGALLHLSRAFNTPINVSDTYQLIHPKHSPGDWVRFTDDDTITVHASSTRPLIANINGIHKVVTVGCDHSRPTNFTGLSFVYMDLDTPEIGKNHATPGTILETPGSISVSQDLVETDTRVPIGEFFSAHPGEGIEFDSVISHAPNASYDTLWFRCNSEKNLLKNEGIAGFFGGYESQTAYAGPYTGASALETGKLDSPHNSPYVFRPYLADVLADQDIHTKVRIHHNLGTMKRWNDAKIKVFVAPNIPGPKEMATGDVHNGRSSFSGFHTPIVDYHHPMGPDYAYVQELETNWVRISSITKGSNLGIGGKDAGPGYAVTHADRNYCDLTLYNMAEVPGGLIGVQNTGQHDVMHRNIALTGQSAGDLTHGEVRVSERTRKWWWTRVVIE